LCDKLPEGWRSILKQLGCSAVHCNYKSLTGKLAADIHEAGYGILVWTVNDVAEARRLLSIGANCLVTDALDRIGPDFG
jgi:glycerophosphoryl diester phosphodiesterase